jgi:hypothetical protein
VSAAWASMGQHLPAGSHYRDFLNDLPKILPSCTTAATARKWHARDGAPAHFGRAVRDVRNNTCHDGRTGTGGPAARPPSSPDLIPLDSCPCEDPKLLCMQLLLTAKRYFSIALWTAVRPTVAAPAFLDGCSDPS